MKTIHKHVLRVDVGTSHILDLQENADLLSVGEQNGNICLWALVDPLERPVARKFSLIGTGQTVPHGALYVGTVQMHGAFSRLVLHVFEETD